MPRHRFGLSLGKVCSPNPKQFTIHFASGKNLTPLDIDSIRRNSVNELRRTTT
jgi:hypothetical protein